MWSATQSAVVNLQMGAGKGKPTCQGPQLSYTKGWKAAGCCSMACRNGASKFQPFYKVLHSPIWLQDHPLGLHESVPIVIAWLHMYGQGLGSCHTSQTSAMLPASTVSVLIPEVAKACAKSTLRPCTVAPGMFWPGIAHRAGALGCNEACIII